MWPYLRVGVVAGLVVGLVFALYTGAVFLPIMEQAAVYEHHATNEFEPHAHPEAEPAVGTVAGIELTTLLGSFAWVVTLGVLTAIGFYFAEPMLASIDRHTRGLLVGLAGFVAFRIAPWPVHPPVSPAAELTLEPEVYVPWYWAIVAITAVTFLSLPFVYRWLHEAYGTRAAWSCLLGVLLIPVVAVAVAPANPVISPGAPSALHTRYMVAVVGGQLAVWVSLGLFIGHFAGVELPGRRSVESAQRAG